MGGKGRRGEGRGGEERVRVTRKGMVWEGVERKVG